MAVFATNDHLNCGNHTPHEEENTSEEILKQEDLFIHRYYFEMKEMLDKGVFGKVRKASLHLPLRTSVAVKILSSKNCDNSRSEVWSHLKNDLELKYLYHDNVITVIGISIKSNGYPMAVMPLMVNGDLHTYVQREELTVLQLLKFGCQVAEGMDYLASENVVHRNLAAKNCLLDEYLTVKISSFGLVRSLITHKNDLPLRWMAIESIAFEQFSIQSDVWSFGVLMWELLTRGEVPYHYFDFCKSSSLLNFLVEYRLEKPIYCPKVIYSMMLQCWRRYPRGRPTFEQLHKRLKNLFVQWENDHD